MSRRLDCELGRSIASVTTTRLRARIGKLAKGMRSRLRAVTNLGLRLLHFYFCWRYWFGGAKVVHVAFDAVRVHGLSRMMGFITLLGGMGVRLPPQARANLSGRRAGTLEPVGGRAPGSKKTTGFFSKTFITISFYWGLRPQ